MLTGRVLWRGDAGFESVRRGFALRAPYDSGLPRVVAFAQNEDDVSNAIRWARAENCPVAIRSGGHSFEALSSLAADGLIIDLTDLDQLWVDSKSPLALVGAGNTTLALTEKLSDSGFSLPMATGPGVGISGLALAGGFGLTSRLHGLTCDHLQSVTLVDREGAIREVDDSSDSELMWGLRGGGGGMGVVTRLRFRLQSARMVTAFRLIWPWERFEAVVAEWQRWAPFSPRPISSLLSLRADRTVVMEGQFSPVPEELGTLQGHLASLLAIAPIYGVESRTVSHEKASRMFFGVDMENPTWSIRDHSAHQMFKSSSSFIYEPLPLEAISMIREALEQFPILSAAPSQAPMVQLLAGGGAIWDRKPTDTAAFHRGAHAIIQFDAYWTAPQDAPAALDWARSLRARLVPYTRGAYVGYHDLDLPDPDESYFGENRDRVVHLRSKHGL